MTFQLPRFGLSDADLDDLMRFDLLGISFMSYHRLLHRGFVSADCHRAVVAAITARRRMTAGQVQASLGDHLYVIGERDASVAKIGRSANIRSRLRQLTIGSPVPLVVRRVEPGLGSAEAAVHRELDSRRLHGEWFDFGSDDPGKVVREALLSLADLAWLRGLSQAVRAADGELQSGGRPRTALTALADARNAEAVAAERLTAEIVRHEHAVAQADYPARREMAGASLWRTLGVLTDRVGQDEDGPT